MNETPADYSPDFVNAIVEAVPRLLGFVPVASLVVLFRTEDGAGPCLRADIPYALRDPAPWAEHMLSSLPEALDAHEAFVMCFEGEPLAPGEWYQSLFVSVWKTLERRGFTCRELWWVNPERPGDDGWDRGVGDRAVTTAVEGLARLREGRGHEEDHGIPPLGEERSTHSLETPTTPQLRLSSALDVDALETAVQQQRLLEAQTNTLPLPGELGRNFEDWIAGEKPMFRRASGVMLVEAVDTLLALSGTGIPPALLLERLCDEAAILLESIRYAEGIALILHTVAHGRRCALGWTELLPQEEEGTWFLQSYAEGLARHLVDPPDNPFAPGEWEQRGLKSADRVGPDEISDDNGDLAASLRVGFIYEAVFGDFGECRWDDVARFRGLAVTLALAVPEAVLERLMALAAWSLWLAGNVSLAEGFLDRGPGLLESYADRRPGQREVDESGRAVVRDPFAFLVAFAVRNGCAAMTDRGLR